MPLITFQPSGKSIEVALGTELMAAARLADVPIAAPCGGKGTCGKCQVLVVAGEVESESLGALSKAAVAEGFVLACRTRVKQTSVTIEVLEQLGRSHGRFVDTADNLKLVDPALLPHGADFSPLVFKHRTAVPAAAFADGLSDLDRLVRQLQADLGKGMPVDCPLPVLRTLADALRTQNGLVTVTLAKRDDRCQIIEIEAGNTAARHYGIAIDIGTTTVALQLVYLPLEEIVCTVTEYNDQVDCGLDVISRINYGKKPERLEELRQRVVKTINRLLDRVLQSEAARREEITSAVLSGNTTMTHLLLGLKAEYIRLEPYTPTVMGVPEFAAGELGLAIHPLARVVLSPAVGSYVGGDITAGLLSTSLVTGSEEPCLFIDIGTNGEIAIGNRDFLLTCACSAGPAFEGGGIDCGMRAAAGAIDGVVVDPATGVPSISVIGDAAPKGICGSGMISLIANLFRTGWLDAAGKLDRSRPSPHIQVEGRVARYLLATAEASGTGKSITVSELDIDNLIRAKAAIYSAGAVMLSQVGMTFNDLARIYIAGGFGRSLVIEDAKTIGLIPDLPTERFIYLGNTSLMGSYMLLISEKHRQLQQATANRMTYLDLSSEPGYMDEYTGALFLPHTDALRFPSVKALRAGLRV
jgi:uncharacterized 2Fe-2S/4Fe-4S cluster protein (DUF4445 family)